MYAKDPNKPKYQVLIKKHDDSGKRHWNDSKAFMKYSSAMDDKYNDNNGSNPNRNRIDFNCVRWRDSWFEY